MKIYARAREKSKLDQLRTFAGKDIWIRAIIHKECDCYIKIIDIVNIADREMAVIRAINTFYIKSIELPESREVVRQVAADYYDPEVVSVDTIELHSESGIYTTEELREMIGET